MLQKLLHIQPVLTSGKVTLVLLSLWGVGKTILEAWEGWIPFKTLVTYWITLFCLCFPDMDQRVLLKLNFFQHVTNPSISVAILLKRVKRVNWPQRGQWTGSRRSQWALYKVNQVRLTEKYFLLQSSHSVQRPTVLRIHTLICCTIADPRRQVHTDKSLPSSWIIFSQSYLKSFKRGRISWDCSGIWERRKSCG